MFTYEVKENGYPLVQAKGKKEAVKRIKNHCIWNGYPDGKWGKINANIVYVVEHEGLKRIFTIEKKG